jgi:hypothetical protein
VIGPYRNPLAHAAVFCVDEKGALSSAISQRSPAAVVAGPGGKPRFEYKRNGTVSLFAALNTATGEVLGETAPRHTSAEFVALLTDVTSSEPERLRDPRHLRQT